MSGSADTGLVELGNTALALGQLEIAYGHFSAALRIKEEFGDPEGMALCQARLGAVALQERDVARAETLFRRSVEIYRAIGDQGGLVTALDGIAQATMMQGNARAGCQYWQQGLVAAQRAGLEAVTLGLLLHIGEYLLRERHADAGRGLLAFVRRHPSAPHATAEQAQHALDEAAGRSQAKVEEIGGEKAGHNDLAAVTARIQALLTALEARNEPDTAGAAAQGLVEPLTVRELQLLRLLVSGLSYQQIATELIISVGSVKAHAHNIYGKLGVRNRMQAAALCAELGLLQS